MLPALRWATANSARSVPANTFMRKSAEARRASAARENADKRVFEAAGPYRLSLAGSRRTFSVIQLNSPSAGLFQTFSFRPVPHPFTTMHAHPIFPSSSTGNPDGGVIALRKLLMMGVQEAWVRSLVRIVRC